MLEPTMNDLKKHVANRYLLVNVTAKLAREISQEAEEGTLQLDDKPVTMALKEIAAGEVDIIPETDKPQE